MNTDVSPLAMSVQNMVFITIWNVAGEFVSPKNMTVGSTSPSGVRKAAFHLSSCLIQMLLYPHQISNLVNRVHPASQSITKGIRGDMLWFLFVHLLRGQ